MILRGRTLDAECICGEISIWVVTEDKSVIGVPMDGAPSKGCSTATILA